MDRSRRLPIVPALRARRRHREKCGNGPGSVRVPASVLRTLYAVQPTFFVIGQPRAGTTSLHRYLEQHPDICMSMVKEPNHYLGAAWPGARVASEEAYRALFEDKPSARVAGEASPEYLYDEEARRRIAAEVPGALAIVVLRHPVERAFSEWAYLRMRDVEPAKRFDKAFAEDLAGRREDAPRYLRPYRSGLIAEPLRGWVHALGRERLHVLPFEDLAASPAEAVAGICTFLGVAASPTIDVSQQHNAAWLWRNRLMRGVLHPGTFGRRVLDRTIGRGAAGRLARSRFARRRPRLDEALKQSLAPHFLEDAEAAGAIVDLDLVARWRLAGA